MAFFELDKATIQSDQGSSITVPIESDNRFYFICFESQLSEEKKRLELFDPRDPLVMKIDNKYWYVPSDTKSRIEQPEIDALLRAKILNTNIEYLKDFLNYQLKKYSDVKDRLKDLKALFYNKEFFFLSPREHRLGHQYRCRSWVNNRIRKIYISRSKPKPVLKDLLIDPKAFDPVLHDLKEKEFIMFNRSTGKYSWEGKGIELAVLGEVLRRKNFFKDNSITPALRHQVLTSFFNSTDKRGFGRRNFQASSILMSYNQKSPLFKFIRSR